MVVGCDLPLMVGNRVTPIEQGKLEGSGSTGRFCDERVRTNTKATLVVGSTAFTTLKPVLLGIYTTSLLQDNGSTRYGELDFSYRLSSTTLIVYG